ncbi:glutathione S-transferase-like protein [Hydrogenophaga taeniospiralis CCUG 15921]|uniref:Glutathione S-transferase-like protein n=1 Tax=Hydrogenophaga taeniospiralis CCUG 15921 TaxID=1281780 RepID=A0A9X4NUS2_9BURK|nr:glutathione S-transferase [Hydrogenophaga taeniospiralis]MDG5977006.1 glutathione S-transferase-like protein [Hydrogenophaga taeniospiralis CCUG 15921]
MQLIGMLDSPYVRRVAISLQLLDLPFEHQSLSVFRTFDEFSRINPVVKAPTLVCDDGTVLMDSTLILQYAEALAGRSLFPKEPAALAQALRTVGLALAACEKAVQIVYERGLRPAEKQHEPWVTRVTGQLLAACDGLETRLNAQALNVSRATLGQAEVSTAVAWQFIQQMLPAEVPAERYPLLCVLSGAAEALPEFCAAPHGDSTYRAS